MKLLATLTLLILGKATAAQDCSNFYYCQNNKTIEMTISNNKGKESGKMIYKISDTKKSGGSVTATVKSEFIDTKGKTGMQATNKVQCVNGVMQMDMKFLIPAGQQQTQAGTATATDVYLEYPATMNVGDQLKEGHLAMDTESQGGIKSYVEIDITDRKVVGKEPVTTAAGTWECFKITSKNKITSRIAGIGIPIKMDVTEWFAPGFGIVKTESKGGKTEITSIK
jgi:hypothetical protein